MAMESCALGSALPGLLCPASIRWLSEQPAGYGRPDGLNTSLPRVEAVGQQARMARLFMEPSLCQLTSAEKHSQRAQDKSGKGNRLRDHRHLVYPNAPFVPDRPMAQADLDLGCGQGRGKVESGTLLDTINPGGTLRT
jgi:hypothetical protein